MKKLALILLTFPLVQSVQADWKNNAAYGAAVLCLSSAYTLYDRACELNQKIASSGNSFHRIYSDVPKQLLSLKIAGCFSLAASIAFLSIPFLRNNGTPSTKPQ